MRRLPLLQVDAFTTRPLQGNPCAVVLDADDLTADEMLAIAREMNLSETAFVIRSETADYGARYFTPAEEIPLAGHPTLSVTRALIDTGRLELTGECTKYSLELRAGRIQVEVLTPLDGVQQIVMTQPRPVFLRRYNPTDILSVFGLPAEAALPAAPVQTVSTGTPQLMVPLVSLEMLHQARLDVAAYEVLRAQGDFFSPHLFCLSGMTAQGSTFARHFGTPPDLLEDPFTGSATGGMAAHLWHYGLISVPKFIAEQGHWLQRPGQASVEVLGPPENIAGVKVGGAAVVVLRGELVV